MFVRGYSMGLPFAETIYPTPYLFVNTNKPSMYRTIHDKPVGRVNFDTIRDARSFVERYKDVEQFPIYGSQYYGYVQINDDYPEPLEFDPSLVSVVTLDIEVESSDGFPDPKKADKMITSITIRKKGKSAIFSYGDFTPKDDSIDYTKCADEEELLKLFLKVWRSDAWRPDIVTGWYIDFFDIPYLYNRILRLLGKDIADKLSPDGRVDIRDKHMSMAIGGTGNINTDNTEQVYDLHGMSILDYHRLYKKLTFKNHESYKLNYIASVELGEKKIDYSQYKNLHTLYRDNFQLFIEYNNYDCVLVDKLEEKLGLIQLVMTIAYDAKVNYVDTLATVKPWDIIIHNYLMNDNIVVDPMKNNVGTHALVGGYVKDVQIGMHKWVVSVDLDASYPHQIMQYNISPEMFVTRLAKFMSMDELLDGKLAIDPARKDQYAVAANGCIYRKDKQGFLSKIMEMKYSNRSKYKGMMIDAKDKYEKTKKPELVRVIARFHNLQLAMKYQLNSGYGALTNLYFRWFNFDHAEAITTSGQLAIRWIERKINEYMNKLLKTKGVDYVIAVDTDSVYINMGPLVDSIDTTGLSDIDISRIIDKFYKDKLGPFIDSKYVELADMMSAMSQRMKMKRETIASKGIWKAKKMYILNAINIEGVEYAEPQLKITGIEAVRSSTPESCRKSIKAALSIIMNKTEGALWEFIDKFRGEFNKLPFEDVARPSSMNNLTGYADRHTIFKKGSPIHVKGALVFNNMLKKLQDDGKLKEIAPIKDGDKVKYAYLTEPNPLHVGSIATPDYLPPEFGLDRYINKSKQFEKTFLGPIQKITSVIGWDTERRATLRRFAKSKL